MTHQSFALARVTSFSWDGPCFEQSKSRSGDWKGDISENGDFDMDLDGAENGFQSDICPKTRFYQDS